MAYILVPVFRHLQVTLENPSYNTPELRAEHYKNADHVRMYGMDFAARLEAAGFIVRTRDCNRYYTEQELIRYEMEDQTFYRCTYL